MSKPVRHGRYAGTQLDVRMSGAFGLLILVVMLLMAVAVGVFYQALLHNEENRLTTTLSDVIGQAVNRVSFSGRYHSQLLIEELQARSPNISYIAIHRTDGTLLGEAGTRPLGRDRDDHAREVARQLLTERQPVAIIDINSNGVRLKEIVLPYRSGYGDSITGTVHVVISFAQMQADMRAGLWAVLAVAGGLFVVAVFLVGRISRHLGAPVRCMAEQLGGILDFAPLPIVIRDRSGTVLDASASYVALAPGVSEALLGGGDGTAETVAGTPVVRRQVDVQTDTGLRHFQVVEFPIARDRDGRPLQVCTIANDETERRKAEDSLRGRSEELERSNAELEQFAYVASHDLQEPLRMVASYVALIERRYNDKLDQDGHDFIGYAKEGAERMQRLIMDLLDYSRIGRKGSPRVRVAMTEPLQSALTSLRNAITQSGTTIELSSDMPMVYGSVSELTRVWLNLIGNAIKYAHPDRPPQIRIAVRREGDEWVFAVRDNGIGIDEQYKERVFMIFQRLHPRDQYPGSGIGLAICQKIITQHGGRIWLEPQAEGSLFLFSLPVA